MIGRCHNTSLLYNVPAACTCCVQPARVNCPGKGSKQLQALVWYQKRVRCRVFDNCNYNFSKIEESYVNYPFDTSNIDEITPIYLENYNKVFELDKSNNRIKEYNDDDYDSLLLDFNLDNKITAYNKGVKKSITINKKKFQKYIYPDTKQIWKTRNNINRPWFIHN